MPPDDVLTFYDSLAEHYHLIFDDWDRAIARQQRILEPLLGPGTALDVLDFACGIGTQSIALARAGHQVTGSDLSPAEIARARREAHTRGLEITFEVADMTSLTALPDRHFDVVCAFDNALPHLTAAQLPLAIAAATRKLKPGGLFLASLRDYDALALDRPTTQPPAFFGENATTRIVHQIWDWTTDDTYIVHLYLTTQTHGHWSTRHFTSTYRCLLRAELTAALALAGYEQISCLMPAQTGFYQPIISARLASRRSC